jgi:hypothetical protein
MVEATEPTQYASISKPISHVDAVDSSSASNLSKESVPDPNPDPNLPYRTLSPNANMAEFTQEKPNGEMAGPIGPDGRQYKLVTFMENDPGNPKNWSKAFKWYCTMVVAFTCFTVAFASAVITADMTGVEKEFNKSEEVALASISVFVVGFGVGEFCNRFSAIPRMCF